jgi:outer membrane lipoprotein-sorting protein
MFKFSQANGKISKLHDSYRLRSFNKKTGKKIYSFDILSGISCAYAHECKAKVIIVDGKRKVKDGKDMKFRCFSASQEAVYSNVYKLRANNFNLLRSLKTESDITEELLKAFPKNVGIVRFHVAGDVFKKDQFLAYCNLAKENAKTKFYSYTKNLKVWTENRDSMPDNYKIIASRGGRLDHMISQYNLPEAVVIDNEKQAKVIGYPIDYDDSHALYGRSCCLVIHGQNPPHINLRVKNSFIPV